MKLGRKPAVRTRRTMMSAISIFNSLDSLGAPPTASDDYVTAVDATAHGDWGMLGNDKYGCCVEADDGHFLMLRTANAGQIVVPTEDDILTLYGAQTGFTPSDPKTDQGSDETSDCAYMVSNGLLGHKADATGAVDPGNLDHIRWCIQLFGGCKFGVMLPKSAEDQFAAGQPWSVVADDGGILGGHDVLGVRYVAGMFEVVTWKRVHPVEPAWLLKYLDEAHVLLFADWIRQNGNAPSGFSLAALLADLPKVA